MGLIFPSAGIYGFVDGDDIYYTYANNEIYSFENDIPGDSHSPIHVSETNCTAISNQMKSQYLVKTDSGDRVVALAKDLSDNVVIYYFFRHTSISACFFNRKGIYWCNQFRFK